MEEALQNIGSIQNFYQLVSFVIVLAIPTLTKWQIEAKKKKIAEKERKTIDTIQNEKLENIEKQLKFVIDITKDTVFIDHLQVQLIVNVGRLIAIKELKNKELQDIIKNAITILLNFVKLILSLDFKLTDKELKENAYFFLRKIKYNVYTEKLGLKEPIEFLEKLQYSIIIPEIDFFILNFDSYKKLSNGDRRKQFGECVSKCVENIVIRTIDLYHEQ